MPGEFIDVRVDEKIAKDAELARKLAEICPVSIFEATPDGVSIDESNLDECVLCDLCLEAVPKGKIEIIKLYENPKS
jgi:NAD-dependent dihydropyrimidine dehydrogenase PreA subunit